MGKSAQRYVQTLVRGHSIKISGVPRLVSNPEDAFPEWHPHLVSILLLFQVISQIIRRSSGPNSTSREMTY